MLTRAQQHGLVSASVSGRILAANDLCLLSPDGAVAFSAAGEILLVIHGAEEDVACAPSKEYGCCAERGPLHGMACKILDLEGVDGGKPGCRTPSKIETKMVEHNVDGPKVPSK